MVGLIFLNKISHKAIVARKHGHIAAEVNKNINGTE